MMDRNSHILVVSVVVVARGSFNAYIRALKTNLTKGNRK